MTCWCGKRVYHTRAEAKRVAKRMRGTGADRDPSKMHVYRCGDGFHLGHSYARQRESWRAA